MGELKDHNRQSGFQGFEPLESNYVYCPNQFFDVCLPHGSRGVVRLVAYLLRRTLGWLDEHGEPLEQDITVTYRDLITNAGISRGAIRAVIDDGIALGCIECLREGRAKQAGTASQSAQYRLRWGSETEYMKSPDTFDGFYAGEGHRSPIPNAFFDQVIPQEPLSVVKVVGTVLRHTVGYQNQFGGRRTSAPLSHAQIAAYCRLSEGKVLSEAIQRALSAGYIERLEAGRFSHHRSQQQAARYGVRWLRAANKNGIGSKNPAESNQFKKPNSNGSETPTDDRFKKPNSRKTHLKNTDKQQAAAVDFKAVEMLRAAGFDDAMARQLAGKRGVADIQRQIDWLEQRNPNRNRLGMLRKAIEENWPSPIDVQPTNKTVRRRQRTQATNEILQNTEQAAQRRSQREQQLQKWKLLDDREKQRLHRLAIDSAKSAIVRRRLQSHVDLEHPPTETLMLLDASGTTP